MLKISEPLMAGFMVSNRNILLFTKPIRKVQTVDSSTVEVWRKEQLLKITEDYNTNLTRHWVLKRIHAMAEEFHGEGNSSVSLQCQID
jgi:hypothetical protein